MLRVGVIGANHIGRIHARVYADHPAVELRGICDIDRGRADSLAHLHGIPAYYSVQELLNAEALDAVSVATGGFENGAAHFEPVMECFAAGVNVLCEKPISNDIRQAREMVQAAAAKRLYFGINLNHRFVPPAERARQWLTEGRLGYPVLINMTMWLDNGNESSPWFHMRALHPHSIDVMRYFCGEIVKVHAFMNRAPGRVCWSNAQVNLLFANGVVGHLTGSYDAAHRHNLERCEVLGTEGRFVLDNCYEELTLYPRRSDERTVIRNPVLGGFGGFDDTFTARIGRWVEQIEQRVSPEAIDASGADGLACQEVIEAAIHSHETGAVVEIKSPAGPPATVQP